MAQDSWLQRVKSSHMEGPFKRSTKASGNLHAAAAARARGRFMVRGIRISVVTHAAIRRRRRHIEQGSAKRELFCAVAIGKQPVITNAMEAVRQSVQQEAADELVGCELHDFGRVVVAVILPGEPDIIVV